MRILAIRGANLASLKGNFEVDLARPPLCHLGLFAIAGPVGAGKSTLLDTMCLALFNRTPRLSGRGGSQLTRDNDALRSNDPRSLVRRGVAKAFAEVDFAGTDGRIWRARWQVHRARGQAFGKLQDEVLSLVDVDTGQRIGEGKEGTLAEIEQRLGLSFDEFCRSVLLAQGGFSTFLKARPEERAALLEKITGTDLYSNLSIQAHLRARDEGARLKALEDEVAAMPPATAEARASLVEAEASAAAARAHAEQELARLEARARDAARAHDLARAVDEATTALEVARAARASSPAASIVTELEVAWPLRALVKARDEAARRLDVLTASLEAARLDERRARGAVDSARERRQRADEAHVARARDLARAEADLQRAVILDEKLARAEALDLVQAHARAASEHATLEAELGSAQASQALIASDLYRADEVLGRAPELEALVPAWPSVEHDLQLLGRDDTELEGAHAIAAAMERRRDEARAVVDECAARVEQATQAQTRAHGGLHDALARLRAAADEPPTPSIDDVAALLATAEAHARRAAELHARLTRAEARAAELARLLDDAREAEGSALDARARVEAAHAAAVHQLHRLERASERGSLVDGEPCPLCGSCAHPAAHDPAPEASVVDEQRRAVRALADDLRVQTERRAAAAARVDELTKALAHARHEESAIVDEQAALGTVPRAESVHAARAALAAARDGDSMLAAARKALADAESARAVADQALALHVHVVETRAATREQRIASLRKSLVGVVTDDELAAPRTLLAPLRSRVEEVRAQLQVARQARSALAQGEPRVRALEAQEAAARTRVEDLARRLEAARVERDEIAIARAALFDGAPASEVRLRLTAALDEAQVAAAEAAASLAGLEVRQQEADARLRRANDDEIGARRAADLAALDLERELARAGLDEGAALRAAAQPDTALDDARGAVRALDEDVARAEAVLAERRATAHAHAATLPETPDADADLERARGAVGPATDAWGAARAALLQDDRARARAAELLPALEAQRARARTWCALSDVIGSADGARFRVFAQSLTLDALLLHANAQLQTLAPRYRLERARSEGDKRGRFDLDLVVVDRESGDDVRSVGSLSGGESFLVSLALALGLSALSSARTRVESLFIDEGFSSLDPETLEAALAALEALRATGRQVGVISHVPALVERLGAQVRVVPIGGGRSRVDVSLAG